MAWVQLLGRKFADVLRHENFDLMVDWSYVNRFGVQGHSYYGCLLGRRFCVSQSRRQGPDAMERIARIFRNGDGIDRSIGPFYSNRKGQVGLIVAAWNGSQWLQVISPGTPDQPNDNFTAIAQRIREDRTIDPQPLDFDRFGRSTSPGSLELLDIIGQLRGRSDFDW